MTPALPASAVLSGLVLTDSDEWVVRRQQHKHLRQAASGRRRQQLAVAPAGGPAVVTSRTFTLRWSSLQGLAAAVEEILALPGPHTLALWRRESLAFPGNGSRTDFELPWPIAVDTLTPPHGLSPDRFQLKAKDPAGAPLTVLGKSAVDYAAGPPAAGELWRLQGGTAFKVAAAPAGGEHLRVSTVPLYLVFEDPETTATYRDPVREPRNLILQEA